MEQDKSGRLRLSLVDGSLELDAVPDRDVQPVQHPDLYMNAEMRTVTILTLDGPEEVERVVLPPFPMKGKAER